MSTVDKYLIPKGYKVRVVITRSQIYPYILSLCVFSARLTILVSCSAVKYANYGCNVNPICTNHNRLHHRKN